MDEKEKIIIRRISRNRGHGFADVEETPVSRSSRWMLYLIFVPVFIMLAILGIFFFSAFLALFAIALVGFSIRLWWLRRKLRKSGEAEEGQYSVIEDAEIVEETVDENCSREENK